MCDTEKQEPRNAEGDHNLNDMVAKVTIETPSGSSTKYYLLYRDSCYSLGSAAVGALGGLGVGFYTKIFFEQTRPKPTVFKKRILPFAYPEIKLALKLNGKSINVPLLFGNTVWWRVGSRGVLASILYCALECQLQGTWYRRTYMDCGLAGAFTGGLFGLRGVPGGLNGAGMGAVGFSALALIARFLFL